MLAKFSPKALKFIRRHPKWDATINILEGSVRSGKTWAMIPKLLVLNEYDVRGDKVLFGVSKETIKNNVLNQVFDFVGTKNYSYNSQTGELWIYNTRWRVVGAKDEGSEKYIRGSTVGVAYGDELTKIPKTFFQMMLTRMSPDGARLYGTTNPDSPFHWLNEDYLQNVSLRKQGRLWSEHFILEDNLSLSKEKIEEYHALYKGVFYKLYILGLWVKAEGVIYRDSFNDDNLYADNEKPIGLLNDGGYVNQYIAIDYGTGNPTVFLHVVDDGNTYWIENEYYHNSREEGKTQKTDEQYIDDLIEFQEKYTKGAQVIIDPAAASLKIAMTNRGVWHCDANNDVLDGIRTTATLFSRNIIKVNKRCKNTIKEHNTYAWDEKAAEKGEDKPIKKNDHSCDAVRYFAHTVVPSYRVSL